MSDLLNNAEDECFRAELRDFVANELHSETRNKVSQGAPLEREDFVRWHRSLYEKGLGGPSLAGRVWGSGVVGTQTADSR